VHEGRSDQSWGTARTKTVTWHDPISSAERGRTMSGLEHLRAVRDGVLPGAPIAALMGFSLQSVEQGDVVFTCTPDESAYNPIGMVHGGLMATLLDSACGCAVQSTLPAGSVYSSLEIKVSFLRAVHAHSGLLTVHGWVPRPGRRAAFAEADVRTPDGKLVATASSTCLVMDA